MQAGSEGVCVEAGSDAEGAQDENTPKSTIIATASKSKRSKRKKNQQPKQKQLSAKRLADAEVNAIHKFKKVPGKMLPWASWEDWLHLKRLLAANDYVAARALLSIFNLHRKATVPVAVSSSVELVSLLNCRNELAVSSHNRRLALSMAIIRFTNGMTDFFQPRDFAQPVRTVATVAARLQLPPLLVEIRHHASHNQLPPLPSLEEGARQALHWLDVFYWQEQHNHLCSQMLLPEDGMQVMKKLRSTFAHKSYDKLRSLGQSHQLVKSSTKPIPRRGKAGKIILAKLVQCIQDWPPRVEDSDGTKSVVGQHETSYGIWGECENRDEWVQMPIGLMPGQNVVPPIPLHYLSSPSMDLTGNSPSVDSGDSCDSCDDIEVDDVVLNAKPSAINLSQLKAKRRAKLKSREKSLVAHQVQKLQEQIDKAVNQN